MVNVFIGLVIVAQSTVIVLLLNRCTRLIDENIEILEREDALWAPSKSLTVELDTSTSTPKT